MDGYEDLIKTSSWEKLGAAKRAVFEAQLIFDDQGFTNAAEYAVAARAYLTKAENSLREHFKRLSKQSAGDKQP